MTIDQIISSGGFSDEKSRALRLCHEYLMPNRVETFAGFGIPLVIGKREGYRIWDMDGHELQDFHLNGGTYNIGHRHPAALHALRQAAETLDVGNHHFPSRVRGELAEKLAALTPGNLHYSVLTPSGAEANDVAIKSARFATGRTKIVSLEAGFHGNSGLSGAAGDDSSADFFHSADRVNFNTVPFNDLAAMEEALSGGDVAAVLIEPIPATFGFPMPDEGYLPGVKALCETHGTLFIADEVQTGLGRTGPLWAVEVFGVEPDILITGKGLAGGLYPMGAAVMSREVGAWLKEKGWGYVSTFGGAEIGCAVAGVVLDICAAPETRANVVEIADYLGAGLARLHNSHPFLKGVRQKGVIFGLEFDDPHGGLKMASALYGRGLWAMFAGYNPSVLQFKAGLLIDKAYCDEALTKLEAAIGDVTK